MPAVALLVVFGAGIFALPALAGPSAATTTKSGVYTAQQAFTGTDLYVQQCSQCHGANLEGKDQNPPLAGSDFMDKWQGQTLGELYEVIHDTMPATKPGTLSPEQSAQLIAYILQENKMPVGKTDLPTDEKILKTIRIEKP